MAPLAVVPSPKSQSKLAIVPSSSLEPWPLKAQASPVQLIVNAAVGAALGAVTATVSMAVSTAPSSSVTVNVTVKLPGCA